MTISVFWRKFKIGPFLLIFSNWRIRFFSWSLGFIKVKKLAVSLFCRKLKIGPFWPKTTKIWPFFTKKLPFLSSFDLILTLNFFIFYFLFEIVLVESFFNIFVCHAAPCDQIVSHFRGSCCVKMTKNSSKSIFF